MKGALVVNRLWGVERKPCCVINVYAYVHCARN